MFFYTRFLLLAGILGLQLCKVAARNATTTADSENTDRDYCDTVITDEDISRMDLAISRMRISRQVATIKEYTFDVYFNVVAANMTEEGGWIPRSQIDAQMDLINERYIGTGVSFRLVNVTRILNRYWHETVNSTSIQARDMHRLFRRGGKADLNVYSVGFYNSRVNGYSTLPDNYARSPTFDGVVLLHNTLPGGASVNRQGGTLIHEAGHWLGLRHTFQGGCNGIGDGISDTPPQAEENYGCPIGIDSCPGGGADPIHNYMDYTNDECRTEFTPGQIELMQFSIQAYRV